MALSALRGALLLAGLLTLAVVLEALYIDVTGLVGYVVSSPALFVAVLVAGGFLAGRWLERSVQRRDRERSDGNR